MKRALITGATNKHIGHVTKTNQYVSAVNLYKPMLTNLGYQVEHRPINIHEDGSKYDLILCGLGCLNSLVSGHGYDTIHLMQYDNVMYYIDDWQVKPIFSSLNNAYNNDSLFTDFMQNVNKYKLSQDTRKRLMKNLETFLKSNPYILFPMFNWGNDYIMYNHLEKTFPFRMLDIDPSSYVSLPKVRVDYTQKKRIWLCASLKKPKLPKHWGFGWPITYFNRQDGSISESKLFTEYYTRYWGNVATKYPHAGSGYWRMRYLHSINSLSILLADEQEVKTLGNSFLTPLSIIENKKIDYLRDIANVQKKSFLPYQSSKKDTLVIFDDHINKALNDR